MMKRTFDLLLIVLLLPVWLPVMILVAMVVLVSMGMPVFFSQERAGKGGRPFRLYKFRTMRLGEGTDAERLTRVGRILRLTSLDELPELWNVLKDDMALVGPRPLPVRYLERYTVEQNRRHEVKPGITGLAQVNGRNTLDWDEKFRFDVLYVDSQSLWLDFKILLKTIGQVFRLSEINHSGEATMSEFNNVREKGM